MSHNLRPGPHPDDLIRRLRAWSLSSWSPDRVDTARRSVQRLADLAADALGEPRRVVPEVGAYAIADQLTVLRRDAVAAGVTGSVDDEFAALAAALGW